MARFDRVIPPGQEGEIHASIDTQKFNGPITKGVSVRTNDPGKPAVALQLKADVRSWVQVLPSWRANFNGTLGTAVEEIVYLENIDPDNKLEVTGAVASLPYLTVEVKKTEGEERGDYKLIMHLSPEAPLGRLGGMVTVTTTNPRQRTVEIPITGKLFGPINYFPASMALAADNSGQPPRLRGTIVLQARPGTETFRVEELQTSDERLRVEPMEGSTPTVQRLMVTWTAPDAEGFHQGTIRIRTDNPQMEWIEVPYHVRIVGAAASATGK